ncbi:MAG: hypothetical protein ACK56I_30010, partial [bacterium]
MAPVAAPVDGEHLADRGGIAEEVEGVAEVGHGEGEHPAHAEQRPHRLEEPEQVDHVLDGVA